MADFKKGDHVTWNSHGGKKSSSGKADGTVEKKITSETKIKGHVAKATKDDPQYLVKSKNGGVAAHKPGSLKKS